MKLKRWIFFPTIFILIIFLFLNISNVREEDIDDAISKTSDNLYNITLIIAFFGGVLTLLSPCLLPILPAYFAVNFRDGKKHIFMTLAFFLGFLLVFLGFGFTVSFIGQFFIKNKEILGVISGLFIILFGLMMFLGKSLPSFKFNKFGNGYFGVFLFGIFFAIGWSPCVGPILFSILFLAANSPSVFFSVLLMAVYSLGIFIPFFILSFYLDKHNINEVSWLKKGFNFKLFGKDMFISIVQLISSILLVLLGTLYLIFGSSNILNKDIFGLWTMNYVFQGKLLSGSFGFIGIIFLLILIFFIVVLYKKYSKIKNFKR